METSNERLLFAMFNVGVQTISTKSPVSEIITQFEYQICVGTWKVCIVYLLMELFGI